MDPAYPLVPVASLIGCFLVLVSFPSVLSRPWNTGVFLFALYLLLQSLSVGISTIIWSDNARDMAPVLCDIISHLYIYVGAGIPSCIFVITLRLFNIVRLRDLLSFASPREKQKQLSIEFLLCSGIPLFATGSYYVVQGSRYTIFEEFGCQDSRNLSGASILLVNTWTVLLPLVSLFIHCPRILWALYRHKREMSEFLDNSGNGYRNDFIRPLALSCYVVIPLLIALPLQIMNIIVMVRVEESFDHIFVFWPGWSFIHKDWEPDQMLASDMASFGFWFMFSYRYAEWMNPAFAFGFFAIYGLNNDTRQRLLSIYWTLVRPFGLHPTITERIVASAIVFQLTPLLSNDAHSTEEIRELE